MAFSNGFNSGRSGKSGGGGGGAATVFYDQNVVPGKYFLPHSITRYDRTGGKGGGEFSPLVGRIVLSPIIFFNAVTVTKVFAKIETAFAGGNCRLGLYTSSAENLPDVLLFDTGDLSTDSTGFVGMTLPSPIVVPAGRYYMADVVDNITALARGSRDTSFINHTGVDDNGDAIKLRLDLPYGPLPASATAAVINQRFASFGSWYQ